MTENSDRARPIRSGATPPLRAARRYDFYLWLFCGTCAFLLSMYPLSAAVVGGVYIPADPDSFYHAHRILDSLDAPWRLYQFDPMIHAPEGSWITWPWAYDTIMATIAHVAVHDFGVRQPLSVLAFVAPLWTFVDAAMLLVITRRLELSLPVRCIALACYACLPLTQLLHRVGMIGHHFVEFSFVLATLMTGLGWFRDMGNVRRAAALGVVLGMAPAFHNGDFILQLPVLATLMMRWLLGLPPAPRATWAFAASLWVATLVMLLPSEPFRRFMFSFTEQSWFHLYVATCTAALACLFARLRRAPGAAAILAAVAAAMLAAIVPQAIRGGDFITGRLVDLGGVAEVAGVAQHAMAGDFAHLSATYSALLWIMPLAIGIWLWLLWRGPIDDAQLFFAVTVLFGATLMMFQFRLEYFGSFALYLPLCLLIERAVRHWRESRTIILAAAAGLIAAAYVPAASALRAPYLPGTWPAYALYRDIYPPMAASCAKAPGVVLADNDDGHYITFHTRCAVIADNFIITRQHEEKILLVHHLLSSSLDQALEEAPYIRYIYVRRDPFRPWCGKGCRQYAGLQEQLLFEDTPRPDRLRLVGEVNYQGEHLARVFEVSPQAREPAAGQASKTGGTR